jgi:quercetin dioxygenase-like cupin family protein
MVGLVLMDQLRRRSGAVRFEGHEYGAGVSCGPGLHRHPYDETFVIVEGAATFTVDDETIEAAAGTIVVVPAGAAHKFVAGRDGLRSVNIHASDRMVQEDLPESHG